jgi:hypothetical protein
MKSVVASLSTAAVLLTGSADAFWRMPCHSRTALARLDPIVDKGVASSHGHVIHGGSSKYKRIPLLCLHPRWDCMNLGYAWTCLTQGGPGMEELSCFTPLENT